MNPFDLLTDYAFIIIFLMIAFFQWFVTKFRKQDEDVFEWPDDDEDKSTQERQQEDPLAEIRRRLEERMGGGGAPPPIPQPAPRRTSPQPSPPSSPAQPQPEPRTRPVPAQAQLSKGQPTRKIREYKEREQKERAPRVGQPIISREEIRRRRLEVDARTEALAASLPTARSAYAKGPRKPSSGRRARVRSFLASPESIRDAVVLQEILGTPRSRRAL